MTTLSTLFNHVTIHYRKTITTVQTSHEFFGMGNQLENKYTRSLINYTLSGGRDVSSEFYPGRGRANKKQDPSLLSFLKIRGSPTTQ